MPNTDDESVGKPAAAGHDGFESVAAVAAGAAAGIPLGALARDSAGAPLGVLALAASRAKYVTGTSTPDTTIRPPSRRRSDSARVLADERAPNLAATALDAVSSAALVQSTKP